MSAHESWREELQSAYLYRVLAAAEGNNARGKLFTQLADAAERQARIWSERMAKDGDAPKSFEPTLRARIVARAIPILGGRAMRPALAALKVRGLSLYSLPSLDSGHAMPTDVGEIGRRHRSVGSGGSLRAAVFGVNDGLVSNASLILGVAGANAEPRVVVLAGVAGLLAGAFSMAAGEYVSVRSQRELYEFQIGLERAELDEYPAEEAEELALIYQARGLDERQARELADRMMSDREKALDTLSREELGLNPDDLGSPIGAATASFSAFALGAAAPLAPFLMLEGRNAWIASISIAALALFAIGVALAFFTGRGALASGVRMLAIGSSAAALTWLVGKLFGVTLG